MTGILGVARLDRALAEQCPDLSRSRIAALIAEGRVRVAGTVVTSAATRAHAGEAFTLDLPPPVSLDAVAEPIALDILHEDDALVVVDKPAGLVVHPAAGHPDGTLVNALLHHCGGRLSGIGGVRRPGIVHRIDRDTSGIMVVAKTDVAHEGLARQFAAHTIDRRYLALVDGRPLPPAGRIATRIGRSDNDRKKMAVLSGDRGKVAVTHYATVHPLDSAALVECRLETGRTHQVRVHMAHIGHPLIGDPVYNRRRGGTRIGPTRRAFRRQALHAAVLGFTHPVTGEAMRFTRPMPADMQELFTELTV